MKLANTRIFFAGLALASVVCLLDQASKVAIFERLLGERVEIEILPFFTLVKRFNLGISFSLLATGHPIGPFALAGLAIAIAAILVLWLARATHWLAGFGLGLIIGGAMGNVIDRLLVGAVRDFLLFHWRDWAWPAFNLADSAISVGVAVLLLDSWLRRETTKS